MDSGMPRSGMLRSPRAQPRTRGQARRSEQSANTCVYSQ